MPHDPLLDQTLADPRDEATQIEAGDQPFITWAWRVLLVNYAIRIVLNIWFGRSVATVVDQIMTAVWTTLTFFAVIPFFCFFLSVAIAFLPYQTWPYPARRKRAFWFILLVVNSLLLLLMIYGLLLNSVNMVKS